MFLLATFELLKDHPRGTVSSWQKAMAWSSLLSVGPLEVAICIKGSAVCGGPGFSMDRVLLPGRSHLLVGLPSPRRISGHTEASGFDFVSEFTDIIPTY